MNNKELFFVLTRPGRHEALLLDAGDGLALPCYETHVSENVGFSDPGPFNRWFRDRYGIMTVRRYAVDLEGTCSAFFIQEVSSDHIALAEGAHWIGVHDPRIASIANPENRKFLETWLTDQEESATMPWSRPNGYREALEWMHEKLEECGRQATGGVEQVKNAYVSTVFRCPTESGDVYLKILPPVFVREAQVTEQLTKWNIVRLPQMIDIDVACRLILTEGMPGCDLTDCCTLDKFEDAVHALASFQISAIQFVDTAKPNVFYNWKMEQLSNQLGEEVDSAPSLLSGSPYEVTQDEVSRLHHCVPAWRQLCAELQDAGIPDSLDHGDLRPGNIRVVGDDIIFYDWAWSAVTHPFLSITTFLHVIGRTLPDPERDKQRLRDAYLEAWTGHASCDVLLQAFDLADKVKTVYGVVADAKWLRAIRVALGDRRPETTSADAWTLRWRQYYFAKMLRRLLQW